jgi:pyruvate kinase
MLSGESAMGKFPEEAVRMLAKIATFTETHRPQRPIAALRDFVREPAAVTGEDRMASLVEQALESVPCDLLLVPTRSGTTARKISRFKPRVWLAAPSPDPAVCQGLAFCYGVQPVEMAEEPSDWREYAARWVAAHGVIAKRVLLVAGPSARNPHANHRIELMKLDA